MTSGAWSIAPPVTWASAWWPRQTPSTGTSARCERVQRDAEVALALGAPGAGRDHDVVHGQRRELLPRQLVVAHDDRLLAVDLAQQVEEVEGERVVVVDQERAHRPHLHSANVGTGASTPIIETVVTTINPDGSVNCGAMGVEWGERADRDQALPGTRTLRNLRATGAARREPDRRHPAVQPGGARRPAPADPSGGRRRGRGARRRLLVARGARGGDRRRVRSAPGSARWWSAAAPGASSSASTARATRCSRRRSSPRARACSTAEDIRAELRRLQVLVDKTGGPREREAMEYVRRTCARRVGDAMSAVGPRRGARAPAPGHARGRRRRRAALRRARGVGQPPGGRARGASRPTSCPPRAPTRSAR